MIETETIIIVPSFLLVFNEILKRFGMPDRFCVLINFFGGAILFDLLVQPVPADPRMWVLATLNGFLLGASAGGIYDLKNTFKKES